MATWGLFTLWRLANRAITRKHGLRTLSIAFGGFALAMFAAGLIDDAKAGIHPERLHMAQGVLLGGMATFLVALIATLTGRSVSGSAIPEAVRRTYDQLQSDSVANPAQFAQWSQDDLIAARQVIVATEGAPERFSALLRLLDAAIATNKRQFRSQG